ncbi:uncharacterized protein LOC111704773 isoform X5 [Eurytemora carolleeae]|uniref:uncharacterized protein LOC111704773 isoform X5 n=1 Tax=Eurytemora carolleeae TaxID=1294199 RepID=UPI000C77FDCF|nr:uncharacterized protein LOC111704773 isoform X5 [Eurytemora carolleeae]|eukprot:XP_023332883.1 uncharacterized protein LOC111704773 isoform X5 [Eurytemora affinis]
MLDVEKGWEAFNNFENYLFIPDCEDFLQFTGKWNVRHQAAVDAGISYSNSLLAFKLLRNSNLSAPVQSRILSKLNTEFKDDCYNVHLITYLISKETQNKQNFKSVPKQVNSEQSLGCLPIEEKVDIPRETDPLYSDETIKLEYYNVEEEMVDNDKDEGIGEDDKETVTVNEGQAGNDKKKENPPRTIDQSDSENEGANEKKKGKRKLCKTPWEYSGSDPSDVDEPISTMPEVAMNHERASIYDSSALSEDKVKLSELPPLPAMDDSLNDEVFADLQTEIPARKKQKIVKVASPVLGQLPDFPSMDYSVDNGGRRLFTIENCDSVRKVNNPKDYIDEKNARNVKKIDAIQASLTAVIESQKTLTEAVCNLGDFVKKKFHMLNETHESEVSIEMPFDIVKNEAEIQELESQLANDMEFKRKCKSWLRSNVTGQTPEKCARIALPMIFSTNILTQLSWTAGYGPNKTKKPFILKVEYPEIVKLLKESIQSMTRFQQNYKMSPRGSEKLVENGISKFCRNLLDKINKENRRRELKGEEGNQRDPQPGLKDPTKGTQEEPQPGPSGLKQFLPQPNKRRFEYQEWNKTLKSGDTKPQPGKKTCRKKQPLREQNYEEEEPQPGPSEQHLSNQPAFRFSAEK